MESTSNTPTDAGGLSTTGKIVTAVVISILALFAISVWIYRRLGWVKSVLGCGGRVVEHQSYRPGQSPRNGTLEVDVDKGKVEMTQLSSDGNTATGVIGVSAHASSAKEPIPSGSRTSQLRRQSEVLDQLESQPLPQSPPQSSASDTTILPTNAPTSRHTLKPLFVPLRRLSHGSPPARPRSELPPLSPNPWGGSQDQLLPARPHSDISPIQSSYNSFSKQPIKRPSKAAIPPLSPVSRSRTESAHVSLDPSTESDNTRKQRKTASTQPSTRSSTAQSHFSGSPSVSSIRTADLFFNFLRHPTSGAPRSRPTSSRQSSSPSSSGTVSFSILGRRSSNPLQVALAQELTDSPICDQHGALRSAPEERTAGGLERVALVKPKPNTT